MTNTQKTTMTFTGYLSIDFTFIARDLETLEENLKELQELSQGEAFEQLPVKNQVMTKLVLEAYQKGGIEGGIREMVRFNFRNSRNELDELTKYLVRRNLNGRSNSADILTHWRN